jgi:hypothetical protein
MTENKKPNLDQALDLLSEARNILFQQLHDPEELSHELVRGVDKLGQAIEFAENPHAEIHLCPDCGSLCSEPLAGDLYLCLCCDRKYNGANYQKEG